MWGAGPGRAGASLFAGTGVRVACYRGECADRDGRRPVVRGDKVRAAWVLGVAGARVGVRRGARRCTGRGARSGGGWCGPGGRGDIYEWWDAGLPGGVARRQAVGECAG